MGELQVWINGIQNTVSGLDAATTCQETVIALAQSNGLTGRFNLIEKTPMSERCIHPSELPLQILLKHGQGSPNYFILRKKGESPSSSRPSSASSQSSPVRSKSSRVASPLSPVLPGEVTSEVQNTEKNNKPPIKPKPKLQQISSKTSEQSKPVPVPRKRVPSKTIDAEVVQKTNVQTVSNQPDLLVKDPRVIVPQEKEQRVKEEETEEQKLKESKERQKALEVEREREQQIERALEEKRQAEKKTKLVVKEEKRRREEEEMPEKKKQQEARENEQKDREDAKQQELEEKKKKEATERRRRIFFEQKRYRDEADRKRREAQKEKEEAERKEKIDEKKKQEEEKRELEEKKKKEKEEQKALNEQREREKREMLRLKKEEERREKERQEKIALEKKQAEEKRQQEERKKQEEERQKALAKEKGKKEEEKKKLEELVKAQETRINHQKTQLSGLDEAIQSLFKFESDPDIDKIQDEIVQIEQSIQRNQAMLNEKEFWDNELELERQLHKKLEASVGNLKDKVADCDRRISQKREEISTLSKTIKKEEKKVALSRHQSEEVKAVKDELKELKQEYDVITSNLEKVNQKLVILDKEFQEKQKELELVEQDYEKTKELHIIIPDSKTESNNEEEKPKRAPSPTLHRVLKGSPRQLALATPSTDNPEGIFL